MLRKEGSVFGRLSKFYKDATTFPCPLSVSLVCWVTKGLLRDRKPTGWRRNVPFCALQNLLLRSVPTFDFRVKRGRYMYHVSKKLYTLAAFISKEKGMGGWRSSNLTSCTQSELSWRCQGPKNTWCSQHFAGTLAETAPPH